MTDLDDHQLLTRFAREGSEEAFTHLVQRYVNLVYSSALRQTNDAHAAQEVVQAVFLLLSRKAGGLSSRVVLAGWLCHATRLTALNYLRTENRRIHREHELYMESQSQHADVQEHWQAMAPVLDDALARLKDQDRDAIVLRFFENKSMAEVGLALGASEDAAKVRMSRALEKLRKIFLKRGVTLSVPLMGAALSTFSVQAAPAGLVTTATVTKGVAAGTSIAALMKATSNTMAWLKVKLAAMVAAPVAAVTLAAVAIAAQDEPYVPLSAAQQAIARQVLNGAFTKISAPLPPKMRFVAEVAQVHKPWTEGQIAAEVERQDKFIRDHEAKSGVKRPDISTWPPAAQEKRRREDEQLRQIRMESVRFAHGTRTFVKQEWLADTQWRSDSLETTVKPDRLRALERSLDPGLEYETTILQTIVGPGSAVSSRHIQHRLRMDRTNSSLWKKDCFWRAATLEPEFAFILHFAVSDFAEAKRLLKTKSPAHRHFDSFAGLKMNAEKLEALVTGGESAWLLSFEETKINDRPMAVVRLKGKSLSLARGNEIAFFADANNLTNIYRIELKGLPLAKTPYISIRDDFDTNGFPHTWIVETPTDKITRTTVKFKEVEWDAQFDEAKVFNPEVPGDYR